MKENEFIKLALEQAQIAFDQDEVPVGAIIVEDGKIIACAYNQNKKLNDPCAHAEILALRQACQNKNSSRLDNCDLYVSLEPCAMCAAAISLARIKRLYYSASDEKFGCVENGTRFFSSQACFHKPEIYSGFSAQKSIELLQKFFSKKR